MSKYVGVEGGMSKEEVEKVLRYKEPEAEPSREEATRRDQGEARVALIVKAGSCIGRIAPPRT
jgi:hypothetical protein